MIKSLESSINNLVQLYPSITDEIKLILVDSKIKEIIKICDDLCDTITKEQPIDTVHNCEICGKYNLSDHNYEVHVKSKGHQFKLKKQSNDCEICGKYGLSDYNYEVHMRSKSHLKLSGNIDKPDKKTFNCDVCGKFNMTLKNHQNHLKSSDHLSWESIKTDDNFSINTDKSILCKLCNISFCFDKKTAHFNKRTHINNLNKGNDTIRANTYIDEQLKSGKLMTINKSYCLNCKTSFFRQYMDNCPRCSSSMAKLDLFSGKLDDFNEHVHSIPRNKVVDIIINSINNKRS